MVAEADATDWRLSIEARRRVFVRLVEAYHADLVRVAYAISGDADLAADAAQSAWQAAWGQARELRDLNSARSWLLAITANQARRLMRRRRQRARVPRSSRNRACGDPWQAISNAG